jgi:hypothetical protein
MRLMRWRSFAILCTAFVITALPVAADSVQLVNGDLLNGRVVSLDDKQLRLESDTLGPISIPRVKVVTITLGDQKSAAPLAAPKAGKAPAGLTSEAVLKQLQSTGVNAKDIGDIQKMFPQLANPDASKYFTDTVQGLIGGTKSIGDIRKEAIRARDELKKATKGLGPDVEAAAAPYLMILEKFIGETKPPAPPAKAKDTAPQEKK